MRKILWVSNNVMSKEQFDDLKNILGDAQIEFFKCDSSPNYKEVVRVSEGCEIIAIDTWYLGELFTDITTIDKNPKYVITPKTKLIPIPSKTNEETAYHIKHMGWEVLYTVSGVPLSSKIIL